MAKRYEIRIYNERYNINPNYYQGDKDIKISIFARSEKRLLREWKNNLKEYEGETYSVWDGKNIITAGAYDPSDIDWIRRYLKENESDKFLITQGQLEELVRFGIQHPETEFYTESMNDGTGDFLSCTFFDGNDNNASGFWELDQSL